MDYRPKVVLLRVLKQRCQLKVRVAVARLVTHHLLEPLYRRIDSLQDEAAIAAFVSELTDRFGPVPQSILELLQVVRLRWIAVGLGMERIMLKNGKMTISFVSDQNSVFYQSPQFTTIIGNVQRYRSTCQMQEKNGKLVLSFDGVRTVEKALGLLQKLAEKNTGA